MSKGADAPLLMLVAVSAEQLLRSSRDLGVGSDEQGGVTLIFELNAGKATMEGLLH